jgi:hypothetical protein
MRTPSILLVLFDLLSLSSPALAGEDEILSAGIGSLGRTTTSNEASVLQAGAANEARSRQTGDTNGAAVMQLGKGNLAITDQKASTTTRPWPRPATIW